MLLMEAIFGAPGLIAAPIYYAYLGASSKPPDSSRARPLPPTRSPAGPPAHPLLPSRKTPCGLNPARRQRRLFTFVISGASPAQETS